jgi:predicted nuclease with TOPRIM domain
MENPALATIITAVLSLLGISLTAIFTFLYQRKSSKETALNKFVDSALNGYTELKERMRDVEDKLIKEIQRNEHAEKEIERLRDANHKLRDDMQAVQMKRDDELQELREKHRAEIEVYQRRIEELTKRIELLESQEKSRK